MDHCYEEWYPVFDNVIPWHKYSVCASNSDADGLVIYLTSDEHKVEIEFGFVQAMQMLDEGTNLFAPPNCFEGQSFQVARERQFSNIIYEVHNSAFSQHIRDCVGPDLYGALNLRQFNVVTQNYVVLVICRWEPNINIYCSEG